MAITYSPLVIEVAVIQTIHGQPAVNVLHQRAVDETWPKSPAAMARDVANNWQDHVIVNQTDNTALLRFEWRSIDPDDNQTGVILPDPAKNVTGTQPAPAAPPNVAYLVRKPTASRPRGRRDGRMYLTGVHEGAVDGAGIVETVFRNAVQENLDNFYNGVSDTGTFTNNGHYPVVLETTPASRLTKKENGGVEPPPQTIGSRRVTGFKIDSMVATQRDRLR